MTVVQQTHNVVFAEILARCKNDAAFRGNNDNNDNSTNFTVRSAQQAPNLLAQTTISHIQRVHHPKRDTSLSGKGILGVGLEGGGGGAGIAHISQIHTHTRTHKRTDTTVYMHVPRPAFESCSDCEVQHSYDPTKLQDHEIHIYHINHGM